MLLQSFYQCLYEKYFMDLSTGFLFLSSNFQNSNRVWKSLNFTFNKNFRKNNKWKWIDSSQCTAENYCSLHTVCTYKYARTEFFREINSLKNAKGDLTENSMLIFLHKSWQRFIVLFQATASKAQNDFTKKFTNE